MESTIKLRYSGALIPIELAETASSDFVPQWKRFDHIYKHFEAGQHISSWVLPDSHLTKGEAKMQFFGRVLQHASSMTETTKSESVDSKSHFEEMMETEENGAASSLRGHRQIRTFRASSRGRRSRASMSPRGVKRRRENSQPTPDIPSMPTPEEAPDLHQTVDQFSIELANMEEVGNCPDDGLLEDFTLSNWIVTSPTEPS
ncbi:hypothetical protein MGYG_05062 [Nannizzia gypsea CBS 118893]|uniref:Uncharacterized protein n=1 Tax=Arthroderma gypseum (strain ATCC MYA-4604 / CBS 118893) TaxID=535722 RepID=E4UY96_ARTGP|nr:hypothetical protein MGYG_05062 [Nannizzia gypsea CBS 118893]EFR02059.1 hypothetical protein MGYG_05062 [Nannizzia gypsea CBS 118893]